MTETHVDAAPTAFPQAGPYVELRQSLARRVDISPVVSGLMRFIKPLMDESRSDDGNEFDVEIAVREALANAVIHGNRENPAKRVHVTCRCSLDGEVMLTIRDEGPGFDPAAVPDPTDQDNLLRTHGRGIWLMHALMDEVRFEHNGTVVCMRKMLRKPGDKSSGHRSG
jgi:serine/threonine-protein kinase RsbW